MGIHYIASESLDLCSQGVTPSVSRITLTGLPIMKRAITNTTLKILLFIILLMFKFGSQNYNKRFLAIL